MEMGMEMEINEKLKYRGFGAKSLTKNCLWK